MKGIDNFMRGNLHIDEIKEIFVQLDQKIANATQNKELREGKCKIFLAGSAPLIYNSWIQFGTEDIDCVGCTTKWLYNIFPEFHINTQINTYGDMFPYNYEDRIVLMYSSEYLEIYQMCLEDLLFMKLGRWSSNDIEDVGNMLDNKVEIDLDFLNFLIYDEEEARGAGMTDRKYSELCLAYEDFLTRIETNNWIA